MKKKPSKAKALRASAVVPPLPDGYRDGALPPMPLRNAIVHIASADPYQRVPSGIEPAALKVEKQADGTGQGTITDPEVAELMLMEARMRDEFADAACTEILTTMQGKSMTAELCHAIRLRLRKLADDTHALARVAAAHVQQRERITQRCKADPVTVFHLVEAQINAGANVLNALIHVSEQMGRPESTIRKAYYSEKSRKTRRK